MVRGGQRSHLFLGGIPVLFRSTFSLPNSALNFEDTYVGKEKKIQINWEGGKEESGNLKKENGIDLSQSLLRFAVEL